MQCIPIPAKSSSRWEKQTRHPIARDAANERLWINLVQLAAGHPFKVVEELIPPGPGIIPEIAVRTAQALRLTRRRSRTAPICLSSRRRRPTVAWGGRLQRHWAGCGAGLASAVRTGWNSSSAAITGDISTLQRVDRTHREMLDRRRGGQALRSGAFDHRAVGFIFGAEHADRGRARQSFADPRPGPGVTSTSSPVHRQPDGCRQRPAAAVNVASSIAVACRAAWWRRMNSSPKS